MEWIYITFRSVTYAQRGERALEQEGIQCFLTRAPRWMDKKGCSYALKLDRQAGDRAEALLDSREIPWLRRYLVTSEGKAEIL